LYVNESIITNMFTFPKGANSDCLLEQGGEFKYHKVYTRTHKKNIYHITAYLCVSYDPLNNEKIFPNNIRGFVIISEMESW